MLESVCDAKPGTPLIVTRDPECDLMLVYVLSEPGSGPLDTCGKLGLPSSYKGRLVVYEGINLEEAIAIDEKENAP